MKIYLNQSELSLESGVTLLGLLEQQQISPMGIALAVNNRIVRKVDWADTSLSEGDKVTMIQATYGG